MENADSWYIKTFKKKKMENQFSDGLIRISLHHSISEFVWNAAPKKAQINLFFSSYWCKYICAIADEGFTILLFCEYWFQCDLSHAKNFGGSRLSRWNKVVYFPANAVSKKLRAELCFALSNWHLSLSFPRAQHDVNQHADNKIRLLFRLLTKLKKYPKKIKLSLNKHSFIRLIAFLFIHKSFHFDALTQDN